MNKALQKNYTPPAVVHQMAVYLRDRYKIAPKSLLDPSAGSGVFGRVCSVVWPEARLTAVEPRQEEAEHLAGVYHNVHSAPLSTDVLEGSKKFDLVFTNPPFPLWEEFVETGLSLLKSGGYLVLLGLRSWGSRSRSGVDLFARMPPTAELRVPASVGFRDMDVPRNGSDSRDYSWWIWENVKTPSKAWFARNLPRLDAAARTWRGTPPGREDLAELLQRLGS